VPLAVAATAHDFGTYHETIPGRTANGAHANKTYVTSQPTMTYVAIKKNGTIKSGWGYFPVFRWRAATYDALPWYVGTRCIVRGDGNPKSS